MRSVAGRDSAGGRSVDIRRQSDSDERGGAVLRDHAIRADASRNECRLSTLERPELATAAAVKADAARERKQTMRRPRRRPLDRECGCWFEVLEPEVLAIDGAAHAGPHELRLDDEFLGASGGEIQR